tara:strand:+ start:1395 stop:2000 length:606 start_codon:yes stop_codon:yes gene_type:complete
MIIESGFDQGTDEWFKARCGNPGASEISNIVTSTGKISTSRENFMWRMAEESFSGENPKAFKTYYTERGHKLEPKARNWFAYKNKCQVQECAMIYPDSKRWHVSPDGIIPDLEEGLEIKCPSLKVHDQYLQKGVCPTEYRIQVQSSLAVTGWKTWWFVSYFPEVTPLIIPVKRDEKLIAIILKEMDRFITDLDALIERLKA